MEIHNFIFYLGRFFVHFPRICVIIILGSYDKGFDVLFPILFGGRRGEEGKKSEVS